MVGEGARDHVFRVGNPGQYFVLSLQYHICLLIFSRFWYTLLLLLLLLLASYTFFPIHSHLLLY